MRLRALKKQSQNKPNSNPIKANFRNAKMNENLFATKNYENEAAFRLQKYKPKQSQFQTGHLLVNRMKPKLLNFLTSKSEKNMKNPRFSVKFPQNFLSPKPPIFSQNNSPFILSLLTNNPP